MAETKSAASGGIGFGGALFLVFLTLKLTHVIAWSWLWVTAPLWGPIALVAVFCVGLGIVMLAAHPFYLARMRRNKKAWEAKRAEFQQRRAS